MCIYKLINSYYFQKVIKKMKISNLFLQIFRHLFITVQKFKSLNKYLQLNVNTSM